jgi:hypothetical protein
MQKLRATIERYGRWQELGQYVDRIEAHLEVDFSISVENAKALLECIGKEICKAKAVELESAVSINAVMKKAFVALGYRGESLVTRISGSLASIGQELGNLRNEISPTSHGKSLDELRARNDKVDLLTREFLIDSTLAVAVFLIRAFEERRDMGAPALAEAVVETELDYDDEGMEDFNTSWDEAFGEFEMGDYSFPASEILFCVDYKAYENEYKAFLEAEPDVSAEVAE